MEILLFVSLMCTILLIVIKHSYYWCSAPTAPPDKLSGVVSSDTLTLMWNSPPFENTNGVIQYYVATITEQDTGKQYTLTATGTVVVFNNLHPYYIYECSVAAYTIDVGPYSGTITLQLDEECECISYSSD